MRISFVMPVKNGGPYLRNAVVSTLNILDSSDELVIINDGSSDGTHEFISNHVQDRRLVYLRNETSLGVAESLNIAIRASRNEFIARMDADDVSLPWRRKIGERLLRKGADFAFTNAVLFGSGTRIPLPQWPQRWHLQNLNVVLASKNPFVHSTMFARKESISGLGLYRSVMAEDLDLWRRAADAGMNFNYSQIPTILYRVHSAQLTASTDWKRGVEREAPYAAPGQPSGLLGKIWHWNRTN